MDLIINSTSIHATLICGDVFIVYVHLYWNMWSLKSHAGLNTLQK
jgi:hypothetical protein